MKFQGDMQNKQVGKMYIARVYGDFPCKVGEELVIEKSIYCVSGKLGKYDYCKTEEEEKQGKTAKSVFKKIWYDEVSNSSLLECQLFTGRTHQIRIHCKSVGCSIINDVNYGGVFIGNPYADLVREKQGLPKKTDSTLGPQKEQNPWNKTKKEKERVEETKAEDFEPHVGKKVKPDPYKKESPVKENAEKEEEKKVDAVEGEQKEGKTDVGESEKKKEEKVENKKDDFADLNDEEQTYVMEIWLHSWKYQYKDKNFEAPLPYWASKDFGFEVKEFRKTDGEIINGVSSLPRLESV